MDLVVIRTSGYRPMKLDEICCSTELSGLRSDGELDLDEELVFVWACPYDVNAKSLSKTRL